MPNSAKVIETAVRLREAAPDQWARFVVAMRDYSSQVAVDMVRCAPELLARGQGLAIQANEIASTLENAPQLYEGMQKARSKIKDGVDQPWLGSR